MGCNTHSLLKREFGGLSPPVTLQPVERIRKEASSSLSLSLYRDRIDSSPVHIIIRNSFSDHTKQSQKNPNITMADPSSVADAISPNNTTDFNSLPIPPLDPTIFSDDLILQDNFLEDLDLDFTFDDDIYQDFLTTLPSSIDPSASPTHTFPRVSNTQSATVNPGHPISADGTFNLLNSPSSGFSQDSADHCSDVSRFLNVPSPESGGFNRESSQESGNKCLNAAVRVLDYPSPDTEICNEQISGPASSQGSGNCGSAVLDAQNYPSPDSGNCSRSLPSSFDCANISLDGADDQKIKLEELGNNFLLKRKKENEDVNSVARTSKYRRSNGVDKDNTNPPLLCDFDDATNEDEEKKRARLMRNRESAQLSRQRKKHYVEELEDKVRTMHSTIQDLNSKISYMMAENASLRQQLSGGAMCPPPPVPLPGMYPHPPPMGYPWMPCPPYVVKSQGSQVPLVPIPRLKPQQPAPAPKSRKAETKKTEGKTKKVASVSFLGLLFFIMLFGGLVPMVNVRYGGMRDIVTGGTNHIGNKFNDQHRGRVLTVNAHLNGTDQNIGIGLSNGKFSTVKDLTNTMNRGGSYIGGAKSNDEPKGRGSHPLPGSDEFVHMHNASGPLIASLYVPRNDKLVKIDGNLIIHSVLASEKAMASRETPERKSRETGLAVPRNLSPAIPFSGRNNGRRPRLYRNPTERQRAIASAAAEKDNLKSKSADGKLQQWFREGLAGPMLRSGMCTEVFQFDVSPASAPGAIVPATSVRNISMDLHRNSTQLNKGRNRRILHGLPIPLPGSVNISEERVARNSTKDNFQGNDSLSSMVVSVLVDPREAGDSDGDGMMGPKSLSRIFVVVLIDSVKYVTYSCMLPLKGTGPHLVTT